MNNFKQFWQNLSPEQVNRYLSLFLATALGSLGTTAFLKWAIEPGQHMFWAEQLAATMMASLIYALIVFLTFYLFSPESRPALKRIVNRD